MKRSIVVASLILLVPAYSLACSFDTDCAVGSSCYKEAGRLEGYCVNGSNPGNNNDRDPYSAPLGGNEGDTCAYDTQCDPGLSCVKERNHMYGVCADE